MGSEMCIRDSGMFVAVASSHSSNANSNCAAYSYDGISWSLASTTGDFGVGAQCRTTGWYSVTYGNGMFVALSTYGSSMYSPNGVDWYEGNMAEGLTDKSWRSLTFGNGYFVGGAVSSGVTAETPNIIYSEDGINWEITTSSNSSNLDTYIYGFGFGNDKFVGVGRPLVSSGPGEVCLGELSEAGLVFENNTNLNLFAPGSTALSNKYGLQTKVVYVDETENKMVVENDDIFNRGDRIVGGEVLN